MSSPVSSGATLYSSPIIITRRIPRLGDADYLDYVEGESQRFMENERHPTVWRDGTLRVMMVRKEMARRAIEMIMNDVESGNVSSRFADVEAVKNAGPEHFPNYDIPDYWRMLCLQFNEYVRRYYDNGGRIYRDLHYFRNKLNRYPATLGEMMRVGPRQRWELLLVEKSIFHMNITPFSDNGLKNLKFVCADGIFEPVYNHEGQACDENTDPVNMGTYNYAPPSDEWGHFWLDVHPYTDDIISERFSNGVTSFGLGFGNVSPDDLPGVPATSNQARFEADTPQGQDARAYRRWFDQRWHM